jgi:uncharacterized protein
MFGSGSTSAPTCDPGWTPRERIGGLPARLYHPDVRFDSFSLLLLVQPPNPPQLDDDAALELQDAHLAHLAQLHEAGHLLAAGPTLGPPDRQVLGVCLFGVDADRARELEQDDPAVKAGRFDIDVMPWLVPGGAMSFTPTRFPHSTAEATAR